MRRNDSGSTGKQKTFDVTRFLSLFVYAQIAIHSIWRLTLRRVLKESLELKCWCEHIAFVLNNINKKTQVFAAFDRPQLRGAFGKFLAWHHNSTTH